MGKMGKKQPKQSNNPSLKKIPQSPFGSTQSQKLVWQMSHIDEASEWGWDKIDCPYFLRNMWKKMRNFETMTWAQILGSTHHTIPVNDIISPAQKRLQQLGHDDHEELVSFHISGKQRIWGIRSGFNSFPLWWDPEHRICPSRKRHT